ncbi:MAG: hypothetical protein AAGH45_13225, partial [Pseudomonadota bacterium]
RTAGRAFQKGALMVGSTNLKPLLRFIKSGGSGADVWRADDVACISNGCVNLAYVMGVGPSVGLARRE